MKWCTGCGVKKPLSEFHRRAASRDGLSFKCKPCGVRATRASQDRRPEVKLAWRTKNRAKINARQAERRDPEAASVRFRAWYAENREAQVQRVLDWAKANPEKRRAAQQRRIARQLCAAGADYTTSDLIEARMRLYGGCCFYCGAESAETIDHRIPLSREGSHWPANLVPCCGSCNFRKGTKTESEFLSLLARREVKPSHHDRNYDPAFV